MDGSKSRNSWQDLAERLRSDIILGHRHPRERLIEDELIAETGATRHAVRRAFDDLERLGLLKRQPNRGVRVRDYTAKEVEELYEIRDALECRAVLRFTAPADAEVVDALRDLAEQHSVASREGDVARIFAINNRFHARIYALAGNPLLAQAIEQFTVATQPIRTRAFSMKAQREIAVAEHMEMVDLIAAGDGRGLAECVSRHINGPKAVFLGMLSPAAG